MKESLVSCIVPVYNVEKYLNQCIESIVSQTYKNIEIILINDGSTDTSPEICDRWEKKDERIIVIHKKNGGLSSARNEGLNQRKGEWVVFIDSDDYVHPQFIEILLEEVKNNKVLMACCNYKSGKLDNDILSEKCYEKEGRKVKLPIEQKSFYNISNDMVVAAWNKIFHYSLFHRFQFLEKKIHEDYGLVFFLMGELEEYVKIEFPLYYYRNNEEGITNSIKDMRQMDLIDVCMEQYYFYLKKRDQRFANLILETCIDFFPSLYCGLVDSKNLDKSSFFNKYNEVYKIARKNNAFSDKKFLKHLLFKKFHFLMFLLKRNRE